MSGSTSSLSMSSFVTTAARLRQAVPAHQPCPKATTGSIHVRSEIGAPLSPEKSLEILKKFYGDLFHDPTYKPVPLPPMKTVPFSGQQGHSACLCTCDCVESSCCWHSSTHSFHPAGCVVWKAMLHPEGVAAGQTLLLAKTRQISQSSKCLTTNMPPASNMQGAHCIGSRPRKAGEASASGIPSIHVLHTSHSAQLPVASVFPLSTGTRAGELYANSKTRPASYIKGRNPNLFGPKSCI